MTGRARTEIDLQATLAASSATSESPRAGHHPIACKDGALALYEDGRLSCEHAITDAYDPRTRQCVDHSIALLLIELALDGEEVCCRARCGR